MVALPSMLLAPLSVARVAGPRPAAMLVPAWALARVLSAARTAELPPLVLGAAWAPALAVLLPMASEL